MSRRAAWLTGLLLLPTLAAAAAREAADAAAPLPPPQPGAAPRDPDFGVRSRQFGLERQVEMFQWRAADGGYARVWNAAPIDSSGFAPGHANPPRLPLENRRWWAEDATLDGRPIDREVLQVLGQWRTFRPNFSRLPANLAASFQPEGDGLTSAENPLEPRIGDLRIRWRELRLPALDGKVELREGRWRLAVPPERAAQQAARAGEAVELPVREEARLLPWLLGGGVAMLALLAVLLRRWRRRRR
ncbi:TMEM43 family protein [Vulcaniibacterium tengchongense]|uniref:Uncharacterized protein DUF1625 n=1 Tax=Vulcaniibacterium tengchongense TaxID=1273429 RepID=A0A3N4VE60_9GAMM|nr:TMEM43 family protein [Vulcaniibacterium tengchongense]RPE81282.1 uncharacterized protein DUF1625 [Vulcaniibacterium tengchongense]